MPKMVAKGFVGLALWKNTIFYNFFLIFFKKGVFLMKKYAIIVENQARKMPEIGDFFAR